MNKKEEKKLEHAINTYVEAWFTCLTKSEKTEANKEALKASYKFVAKQAVKAYLQNSVEATELNK